MEKRVLIVDDNACIRDALWRLFEREPDFEVCGDAENGRDAINQAGRLHPDLIVMDFSMPVMNGLDATRAVKRMMPEVPVIIYSAFDVRMSEQTARSSGVSALVSKTDSVSVLISKARGLLGSMPSASYAGAHQTSSWPQERSGIPSKN